MLLRGFNEKGPLLLFLLTIFSRSHHCSFQVSNKADPQLDLSAPKAPKSAVRKSRSSTSGSSRSGSSRPRASSADDAGRSAAMSSTPPKKLAATEPQSGTDDGSGSQSSSSALKHRTAPASINAVEPRLPPSPRRVKSTPRTPTVAVAPGAARPTEASKSHKSAGKKRRSPKKKKSTFGAADEREAERKADATAFASRPKTTAAVDPTSHSDFRANGAVERWVRPQGGCPRIYLYIFFKLKRVLIL